MNKVHAMSGNRDFVDVSDMVDRHPGGAALLERMRGRDISDVYHRIGHSSTARAWVEEGCKGVLLKK